MVLELGRWHEREESAVAGSSCGSRRSGALTAPTAGGGMDAAASSISVSSLAVISGLHVGGATLVAAAGAAEPRRTTSSAIARCGMMSAQRWMQ